MLPAIHDFKHDVLSVKRGDVLTSHVREHYGDPNFVLSFNGRDVVGVVLADASLYAATWRANPIRHGLPESIRLAIDIWMHKHTAFGSDHSIRM